MWDKWIGIPEGTVNHQAPCPMIEALGATRLNIIFSVEAIYPCYSRPTLRKAAR